MTGGVAAGAAVGAADLDCGEAAVVAKSALLSGTTKPVPGESDTAPPSAGAAGPIGRDEGSAGRSTGRVTTCSTRVATRPKGAVPGTTRPGEGSCSTEGSRGPSTDTAAGLPTVCGAVSGPAPSGTRGSPADSTRRWSPIRDRRPSCAGLARKRKRGGSFGGGAKEGSLTSASLVGLLTYRQSVSSGRARTSATRRGESKEKKMKTGREQRQLRGSGGCRQARARGCAVAYTSRRRSTVTSV